MKKVEVKSEHANALVENSIFSFANNALGMVLGFAVSILTARTLGPEKYGIYNVALWFMSVVSMVIGMGLNFAVTKMVSEYKGKSEKETIGRVIRFVVWIEVTLGVITTILLMSYRVRIADYFFNPEYTYAFAICFAGLIPGILTAIYSSAIEGLQKFKYFLYYSIVITPISLASKIVVLLKGGGIEELLYVNLFFSVINTAFYYFVLRKENISVNVFGEIPSKDMIKRITKYNFSISTIMFLDKIIWDKSENFFLGKFSTASQAGLFNAAYGFSNKLTALVQATFWKVLFPFMSERSGANDEERIKRVFYLSTRYIAFFAFPISAAGMVLSWPLIKYSLGLDYVEAQRVLQVFFFCSAFGLLATPQAAVLYAINKQSFIIKYGILLAVVNLIMDYFLITKHGALGAAIANGVIRVVAYIGGISYTIHIAKVKLPMKSLFKILYSATVMAILMQVVIKVNNELIGFIVSIPIGIIVYLGNSIFIGTFEKEDKFVFVKASSRLPESMKNFMYKHFDQFMKTKNID